MEESILREKFLIHPKPAEVYSVQTENTYNKRGNNKSPNGCNQKKPAKNEYSGPITEFTKPLH